MRKHKNLGFTIVETLIVLAVTSAIFLSSAMLISGQIGRYQYRDGMLRLESNIQDVINDVQTGYFPDITSSTTCGAENLSTSGESNNCAVAGKRIAFEPDGMKIDTLVTDIKADPKVLANLAAVTTLSIKKPYPSTVDLSSSSVLYVLYQSNSVLGSSSGQNVKVYKYDTSIPGIVVSSTGVKICASNGSRKGAVVVGKQGSATTELKLSDDHVGC